jgi:hypothetical protein
MPTALVPIPTPPWFEAALSKPVMKAVRAFSQDVEAFAAGNPVEPAESREDEKAWALNRDRRELQLRRRGVELVGQLLIETESLIQRANDEFVAVEQSVQSELQAMGIEHGGLRSALQNHRGLREARGLRNERRAIEGILRTWRDQSLDAARRLEERIQAAASRDRGPKRVSTGLRTSAPMFPAVR